HSVAVRDEIRASHARIHRRSRPFGVTRAAAAFARHANCHVREPRPFCVSAAFAPYRLAEPRTRSPQSVLGRATPIAQTILRKLWSYYGRLRAFSAHNPDRSGRSG